MLWEADLGPFGRRRTQCASKAFVCPQQFTFVIVVILSLSLSCSTFCMYVLHHYSSTIVMLQEISRIRAAADFHLILKTHGVPNHILVAEMTCAAPK